AAAQAAKITQLNDPRLASVPHLELVDSSIERQKIGCRRGSERQSRVELDLLSTAAFLGPMMAREVHEDLPHELRCHPEKMRAIFPSWHALLRESHPGFVDERCGLQSVVRALAAHVGSSQIVQFPINEGRELCESRPGGPAPSPGESR